MEAIFPELDQELHLKDLKDLAEWLGASSVGEIEIVFEMMPISLFEEAINSMESTYDEFPKDKARTKKIYKKLLDGESPQPIYIENGDSSNFVMEGRHRMVAFKWFKLEEVLVGKVSKKYNS